MRANSHLHRAAPPHAMSGFSLVELMVASAISLFLLGGVIAIFASSRASYETTDRLSRIQETGRFALDQIVTDVRASGFPGCARRPREVGSVLSSTELQFDFLDGAIRGYQSTDDGYVPDAPAIDVADADDADARAAAPGSDILIVRRPKRDSLPLRVLDNMGVPTADIEVPNVTTSGLVSGDIALIYSCQAYIYFQASTFGGGVIRHTVSGTPGNSSDSLNFAFPKNAEVIPVETVVYWVAPSLAEDNPDDVDAASTSLWRRIGVNAAEELVAGVDQMQLRFGVDTTGDMVVDNYVLADAVANWADVYSVEVALLVRSIDGYGNERDVQAYQLLDVAVPAPNDRLMRQVFTTSVGLRNRTPTS